MGLFKCLVLQHVGIADGTNVDNDEEGLLIKLTVTNYF